MQPEIITCSKPGRRCQLCRLALREVCAAEPTEASSWSCHVKTILLYTTTNFYSVNFRLLPSDYLKDFKWWKISNVQEYRSLRRLYAEKRFAFDSWGQWRWTPLVDNSTFSLAAWWRFQFKKGCKRLSNQFSYKNIFRFLILSLLTL